MKDMIFETVALLLGIALNGGDKSLDCYFYITLNILEFETKMHREIIRKSFSIVQNKIKTNFPTSVEGLTATKLLMIDLAKFFKIPLHSIQIYLDALNI